MNTFPVTESTLSAKHLELLLQERYDLSPQTSCKLFRTGMNHLYMVADGEKNFVFRVYTHNWRKQLEVSEELRLLVYLHENDIPVTYPIADTSGGFIREINAPEGIRYGALFSFAEGKKIPRFSVEVAYNIGVAMARMHQLTENFAFHRLPYNAQTLLVESLERTKAFFTHPSDEMAYIEEATKYLLKEYKKVDSDKIRHGVVHMDIWFDNLHIHENNEVTIFDFDFCGSGWLCLDIAYFLFQLCATHPGVESEFKPKADSFLKGYESITKISEEEKRIIPIAGMSVFLYFISIQCDRYDTWSNIFLNEEHLKRFIASLKRILAFQGVIL